MFYQDLNARGWEPEGGARRKAVAPGISLWLVDSSGNMPLTSETQTLLVLSGEGRLLVDELAFLASPGIAVVLDRGSRLAAIASSATPLVFLLIDHVPKRGIPMPDVPGLGEPASAPAHAPHADETPAPGPAEGSRAGALADTPRRVAMPALGAQHAAHPAAPSDAAAVEPIPPARPAFRSEVPPAGPESRADASALARYLMQSPISGRRMRSRTGPRT